MTCRHVLGLIDAGPFADCSAAHLEAAWRHARGCGTCGPALAATDALTINLAALPHPSPARDLQGDVLTRIARIEEARSAPGAAMNMGARGVERTPRWSVCAAALGAAATVAVFASSGGAILIDTVSPRYGSLTAGPVGIPTASMDSFALAGGLILYSVGLFAASRRKPGVS